ncbi:MAG TPA: DNA topoisomerase III [Candidatus Avoscillospira avicola]|uniref:DNA topoisomerase n=1 Tax=Candidatus Avoscillospira avicola TaxID=2840706 RepID=A0A9D1DHQ7_9FIRM|nr:DNA topoisomerase III [Candidatus Avoscillospira avicola]
MLTRLIVTEKPSVAMRYASVLGVKGRQDGYLEGRGYLISWCFGHLWGLADADAYDPKYKKWNKTDLPILPTTWQYQLLPGSQKQMALLRRLMDRADVTEIVNACDPGREGELIFRNVYNLAQCTKPMLRLWVSSMEDEAIREGFAHLRPGLAFNGVYEAALCRAQADWLVGINATRLFSTAYHRTLVIGRVISPTLSMVVNREQEIARHKPETFYRVCLTCEGVVFQSEKMDQAQAEALAAQCAGQTAVVEELRETEQVRTAPALLDLTALQRLANKQLGYTAQQTLDYAQSLYEKKLLTYPRTDSRYLTEDMAGGVPELAQLCAAIAEEDPPEAILEKQVCCNGKVTDHTALLPTRSAGAADLSVLPTPELKLLQLVAHQVLLAVSPPWVRKETEVTLSCCDACFTAKGTVTTHPGWRKYQPSEEKTLPQLTQGQELAVDQAEVKEGVTKPPAHYTEASLLAAMEQAGREEQPKETQRRGIGTAATRAGILERLVSQGFVQRVRGKDGQTATLIPAQSGSALAAILPEPLRSPQLTAQWEWSLQKIEDGLLEPEAFLSEVQEMVTGLVSEFTPVEDAEYLFPSNRPVVGTCPRCGREVTESPKGFFCENPRCRFALWRDNRFFTNKQFSLTKEKAQALLQRGEVFAEHLYSEKTGSYYDATIVLDTSTPVPRYFLKYGQ